MYSTDPSHSTNVPRCTQSTKENVLYELTQGVHCCRGQQVEKQRFRECCQLHQLQGGVPRYWEHSHNAGFVEETPRRVKTRWLDRSPHALWWPTFVMVADGGRFYCFWFGFPFNMIFSLVSVCILSCIMFFFPMHTLVCLQACILRLRTPRALRRRGCHVSKPLNGCSTSDWC